MLGFWGPLQRSYEVNAPGMGNPNEKVHRPKLGEWEEAAGGEKVMKGGAAEGGELPSPGEKPD